MQDSIDYLIRFLINDDSQDDSSFVGYTNNALDFDRYKLVVFKSDFFDRDVYGTTDSLPPFPLTVVHKNIPVLFGENRVERKGNTIILYADIIASSYFLLSRYEETIRTSERDGHGRFPGSNSVLSRNGIIHRPVVDEYGQLLRMYLRETGVNVKEPETKLNKIYLTHDVDAIAHYRNLRSVAGALLRSYKNPKDGLKALKTYFGSVYADPWFTFPFLLELNNKLNKSGVDVETIAFIKPGGGKQQEDRPISNVFDKDFKALFRLLEEQHVSIGLHSSYRSADTPDLIQKEKTILENACNKAIRAHRNHYLRSKEPADMHCLIAAGITDDFTMGYADLAGFRLGTCRPVRLMHPETKELTPLVLHPLTLMDGTLNDERYMNLSQNDAYNYAIRLIEQTRKYNGDLCLLWHNTSVVEGGHLYQRDLYKKIIGYLSE